MRESDQAFFNTEAVFTVDRGLVEELKRRALESPSGRFRLCLHESPDHEVQEMIVVHCRENYSRPHSHPGRASSLLLLEGELDVLIFDADGRETDRVSLVAVGTGGPFSLRLGADVWHMPVCRSEQIVFYETMAGPFDRETVNRWAQWSPNEHDGDGITAYLARFYP